MNREEYVQLIALIFLERVQYALQHPGEALPLELLAQSSIRAADTLAAALDGSTIAFAEEEDPTDGSDEIGPSPTAEVESEIRSIAEVVARHSTHVQISVRKLEAWADALADG